MTQFIMVSSGLPVGEGKMELVEKGQRKREREKEVERKR